MDVDIMYINTETKSPQTKQKIMKDSFLKKNAVFLRSFDFKYDNISELKLHTRSGGAASPSTHTPSCNRKNKEIIKQKIIAQTLILIAFKMRAFSSSQVHKI